MNADTLLFRCHNLGDIMPSENARAKFTDSQIGKMVEMYCDVAEGRKEMKDNKFFAKGHYREQEALTMLTLHVKKLFNKNDQRVYNEYLSGEPDTFIGESILKAKETLDTKCCWSRITYLNATLKKPEANNVWQGYAYMWLTGAKKHSIVKTLLNGTAKQILSEKLKAKWRYDAVDPDVYPEYIAECKQIELNHIFDFNAFYEENPYFEFHCNKGDLAKASIPAKDRIHLIEIPRDEDKISLIAPRIHDCRAWMNKELFHVPVPSLT